jgi:hypothetical protein
MRRAIAAAALVLLPGTGCAVIKTTDVTDATFKRHQSVAVLGWPVYSRVTDREDDSASTTHLAVKADGANQAENVEPLEMLARPIEPALPLPERR